jgi:toxin ParE1/3/4
MKPIVIHREARAELEEAVGNYERQKEGLGLALQAEVEKALTTVRENPQIGSPYKATGFRYFVVRRFMYVIYYTELEEVVWVAAVAHGRRRPGYWRRRRPE